MALFQGCSGKLLDGISVLLREIQACSTQSTRLNITFIFSALNDFVTFLQILPEEYLYRAGEVATEMFFVVSGSLDEMLDSTKVTELLHAQLF